MILHEKICLLGYQPGLTQIQPQKMLRGLKLLILGRKGIVLSMWKETIPFQLHKYHAADLRHAKSTFSHDTAQIAVSL